MYNLSLATRLADNIVDGDSEDPQADMATILRLAFVELPANSFWQAHGRTLAPVCMNAIIGWVQSDEWARSEHEKSRMWGFVYRDAVDQIAHTIAYLTGGYEHARNVMRALHQTSQLSSEETLLEWEMEHDVRRNS